MKKKDVAVIKHRALLVCVNNTVKENDSDEDVYEGAQYAWSVDINRIQRIELVLAIRRGVIVGVFEQTQWLNATAENFPSRQACPGRYGFIGKWAPKAILNQYIGKNLSSEDRLYGSIRYVGI